MKIAVSLTLAALICTAAIVAPAQAQDDRARRINLSYIVAFGELGDAARAAQLLGAAAALRERIGESDVWAHYTTAAALALTDR